MQYFIFVIFYAGKLSSMEWHNGPSSTIGKDTLFLPLDECQATRYVMACDPSKPALYHSIAFFAVDPGKVTTAYNCIDEFEDPGDHVIPPFLRNKVTMTSDNMEEDIPHNSIHDSVIQFMNFPVCCNEHLPVANLPTPDDDL